MVSKRFCGFTLAELLIALAILGVIATFTIPKVLQSQQQQRDIAVAKEIAGMASAAFSSYKLNNTVSVNTGFRDLTQYINYVSVDTISTFDQYYGLAGNDTCQATAPCLRLHNGALVNFYQSNSAAPGNGNRFGVLDNAHYIRFQVDPDGKLTNTAAVDVPGKAFTFVMYPNGRITTCGSVNSGTDVTTDDATPYSYCGVGPDPAWFKWN